MGHSLSGEVFYGIDLADLESRTEEQDAALPQWWHDDEDWKDVLAKRLGWEDSVPYPARTSVTGPDFYETPEYLAWLAHRKVRTELIASLGVRIGHYGYECDGCAIQVTASVQGCDYGATRLSPTLINTSLITTYDVQIYRFCQLLGITITPGDIDWYLCASWA